MSNIDKFSKEALREVAEDAQKAHKWEGLENGLKTDGYVSTTVRFIQRASPQTVLALLDELEAKDKRLNEILKPGMLLPVIDDMDEDNLRHVIKTVCENYSLLHAKWEAAERRIAELEARTLVPVEPTLDQLVAGKRRLTSTGRMSRLMSQRLAEVYRAMVSAAAAGKGEAS